jgi:hypothetical protein
MLDKIACTKTTTTKPCKVQPKLDRSLMIKNNHQQFASSKARYIPHLKQQNSAEFPYQIAHNESLAV